MIATQSKAISMPATPVSPTNPLDSKSSGSTVAVSESEDNVSITSASGLRKQFSIPSSWPPIIQVCIDQKTDEARKICSPVHKRPYHSYDNSNVYKQQPARLYRNEQLRSHNCHVTTG